MREPMVLYESTTANSAHPVALTALLGHNLSRWKWWVKWFVAISHYFLVAFLWPAFAVVTVIAGFCILFSGRSPRRLFDCTTGGLRWSCRGAEPVPPPLPPSAGAAVPPLPEPAGTWTGVTTPGTTSSHRSMPMAGHTVLVTGGTDGIGQATAIGLVVLGARVGVAGRDGIRTRAAAADIISEAHLFLRFAMSAGLLRVAGIQQIETGGRDVHLRTVPTPARCRGHRQFTTPLGGAHLVRFRGSLDPGEGRNAIDAFHENPTPGRGHLDAPGSLTGPAGNHRPVLPQQQIHGLEQGLVRQRGGASALAGQRRPRGAHRGTTHLNRPPYPLATDELFQE